MGRPTIDKVLTHNPKLQAMRARRVAQGPIVRGDLVLVAPSRGEELEGLLVDEIQTAHYGVWYDVLIAGRIIRVDAERVSRLGR